MRRLYSFRDLVALRVVRSLLDNGMSLQRVRRAWDYLRREGEMDDHLADVKLVTDGQTIFHVGSDEGELMDALRQGQLAFFVAIDEIAREVEEDVTRFELDRARFGEFRGDGNHSALLECNFNMAERDHRVGSLAGP